MRRIATSRIVIVIVVVLLITIGLWQLQVRRDLIPDAWTDRVQQSVRQNVPAEPVAPPLSEADTTTAITSDLRASSSTGIGGDFDSLNRVIEEIK